MTMSTQIPLPKDLKSGIYLIENSTPFVVKPSQPVDVVVVYPSNTANAYCYNGGKSLYTVENKPSFVSFERPIELQANAEDGLKWLATLEEFRIGYITDMDLDFYENIAFAKVLVIPGHSEYWTRKARVNFDRFVDAGKHALILSGNTMWWQVRYSDDHTKLIRYFPDDPEADPLLKTVNWCQSSLQYPILKSIGADFNHGGYGLKTDRGWDGNKITSPNSPLLVGTDLKKGDIISLPSGEYDGAPTAGFDSGGNPIIAIDSLNFDKIELIGFDLGSRFDKETIGTFIVFKKKPTSGVIINTASYAWCSAYGMGGVDGIRVKKITWNALNILVNNLPAFSN